MCTPESNGNATLSILGMMAAWPKGFRYSNFVLVSCTDLDVTVKSNGFYGVRGSIPGHGVAEQLPGGMNRGSALFVSPLIIDSSFVHFNYVVIIAVE